MRPSSLLLAIRAISAEFARRIFLPVVAIVSAALVILLALGIWLVTVSAWWWFLLVPIILITLISVAGLVVTGVALRVLRPSQNKSQKQAVREFVDELQNASEIAQTPQVFLLIRLTKDMLFPSKNGLVNQVTTHLTSTKPHFEAIVRSYE